MIFIVDPLKPSKGFLGGLIGNMVYFIKSVTPNVSQFVNFLKNDFRIVNSENIWGKFQIIGISTYFHTFLKKQKIQVISGNIIIQKQFQLQEHQKQYFRKKNQGQILFQQNFMLNCILAIFHRFPGGNAQNMAKYDKIRR